MGLVSRLIAATLCLVALCAAVPAIAQSNEPSSCAESDVETTPHFYRAPQSVQVVAVEYRNISNRTCVLSPFQTEVGKGMNGAGYYTAVNLKKGEIVHSSVRWSTADPNPRAHCQWIEALPFQSPPLRNPLQNVGADILVPLACSPLTQSEYLPGPFVPDWQPDSTIAKPLPSAPILTVDKRTYYAFEPIELDVKLTDRPASTTGCPYLIEKVEDPQGNARLIQMVDPKFACHFAYAGDEDWNGTANEVRIRSGVNFRWGVAGMGANTFTVYQVADPTPYGELRLVASNSVSVNIVPSPRVCMPEDLEPALHFYQTPDKMDVVALDDRNTSASACILHALHLKKDARNDSEQVVVIDAGETAHSSLRWPMGSDYQYGPCGSDQNLNFWAYQPGPSVSIVAPSLVAKGCPYLPASLYQSGPFIPDWKTPEITVSDLPTQAPELVAPKTTYDEGEMIELRLNGAHQRDGHCPALFDSIRGPRGEDLREITNQSAFLSANGCEATSPWSDQEPWPAGDFPIKVEPNGLRVFGTPGKRTFTVSELAGTGPNGEIRLLSSNAVTLTIVDPVTIQRDWGKTEMGVHADLTLDKLSYPLGENIPLHLALGNVSAGQSVYSLGNEGEICPSDYTLTVEREDGSKPEYFKLPILPMLVQTSDAVCAASLRRGLLEEGKIIPAEDTLMHRGVLPSEPGLYRITASWGVYKNSESGSRDSIPGSAPAPAPTPAPTQVPMVTVQSTPLMLRITKQ
ncbi:MAG TPA: hypothetical protein VGG45_11565 [Terracidiphilus sp.]|jgi:hypothetical protein